MDFHSSRSRRNTVYENTAQGQKLIVSPVGLLKDQATLCYRTGPEIRLHDNYSEHKRNTPMKNVFERA